MIVGVIFWNWKIGQEKPWKIGDQISSPYKHQYWYWLWTKWSAANTVDKDYSRSWHQRYYKTKRHQNSESLRYNVTVLVVCSIRFLFGKCSIIQWFHVITTISYHGVVIGESVPWWTSSLWNFEFINGLLSHFIKRDKLSDNSKIVQTIIKVN